MAAFVALAGLTLFLVITATINAWVDRNVPARALEEDLAKKIAVLQWVDKREVLQAKLVGQVAQLRSLGAVPHVGSFDGIWTDGRFGPNGPRTFVPSATGLRQIELAMEILAERENLIQQMRDGIVRTYEQLARWEEANPVPDIGVPYPHVPPPQHQPKPPSQDPKPLPRAFLEATIYNKELTR